MIADATKQQLDQLDFAIAKLRKVGLKEDYDLSGHGAEDWLNAGGDQYNYGINADHSNVREALQSFVDVCKDIDDMDLCI